jgi:uncharacterized membrane protein
VKKIILSIIITLVLPSCVFAAQASDTTFEARVLSIEQNRSLDNTASLGQHANLLGLTGAWQDKQIAGEGIAELEAETHAQMKSGDKVVVSYLRDELGSQRFYITDYVRRTPLYWLAALFAVLMILVGRARGLKALASLVLSFFVILYLMLPGIISGYNPLLISIASSFLILFVSIYVTWGWTKQAHLAFISIAISLFVAGLISMFFTIATKLTGMGSESITFLVNNGVGQINFQGLLLAGTIIGILGVLDDVVISQISTVKQLHEANCKLGRRELFKRAMQVGIDHISSMANTLFLAYVGVALPLLLLFQLDSSVFHGFNQIINSQMIATEVVRTLAGSVGLVLAVPISTIIAAHYYLVQKSCKVEPHRKKA